MAGLQLEVREFTDLTRVAVSADGLIRGVRRRS